MGGRPAARRGARGGEGIQAPRADRARVAAAAASVGLAVGGGAWLSAAAEEPYLARWTLFATLVAAAALAGALVLRRPGGIAFAVGALAVPYLAILAIEAETLDTRAPLLAALLLATTELAYWSLELRSVLADEPGMYLRRIALVAGLVVGTFVAGTVLLALVEAVGTRGASVDVLGAAAAVGAVALLALAATARRTG